MAAAAGAVVPAAALMPGVPGPEVEVWQGNPSARALFGAIAATVLVAIAVPLALYLVDGPVLAFIASFSADAARAITRERGLIRLVLVGIGVFLVLARLVRLVWRLAVLKTHHYRVTSQRIVVESGVFSKRIEEIDMRLVDDLRLAQSLPERLLRIGDIHVLSSDRTAAELVLIGLPHPRDLRERIRAASYGATRGQLFTRE